MKEKNIAIVSLADARNLEDRTRAGASEGESMGPAFWKNANVVHPDGPKERLTVRFDRDVVEWFRAGGRGYQTRMNAVLRSYFEAQDNDRSGL